MCSSFSKLLFCLPCVFFLVVKLTECDSTLNDDILVDTSLGRSGSPYVLARSLIVSNGAVLSIDGGVVVKMCQYCSLVVNGVLKLNGSVDNRVTFTGVSRRSNYWSHIELSYTYKGHDIENAVFEYGGYGGKGMLLSTCSYTCHVSLHNCEFRYAGDAVKFPNAGSSTTGTIHLKKCKLTFCRLNIEHKLDVIIEESVFVGSGCYLMNIKSFVIEDTVLSKGLYIASYYHNKPSSIIGCTFNNVGGWSSSSLGSSAVLLDLNGYGYCSTNMSLNTFKSILGGAVYIVNGAGGVSMTHNRFLENDISDNWGGYHIVTSGIIYSAASSFEFKHNDVYSNYGSSENAVIKIAKSSYRNGVVLSDNTFVNPMFGYEVEIGKSGDVRYPVDGINNFWGYEDVERISLRISDFRDMGTKQVLLFDPFLTSSPRGNISNDCSFCELGYERICNASWMLTCDCDVGYKPPNCEPYDCPCGRPYDPHMCLVCSLGGRCVADDECQCYDHYSDFDCSLLDNCSNAWYEGQRCSPYGICSNDVCVCKDGILHDGDSCRLPRCFGFTINSLAVCSSHGNCTGEDVCSCDEGYFGDRCEQFQCFGVEQDEFSVCGGHGVCTNIDTCDCEEEYGGNQCKKLKSVSTNLSTSTSIVAKTFAASILLVFVIVFFFNLFCFCNVIICCCFLVCVRKRKKGDSDSDSNHSDVSGLDMLEVYYLFRNLFRTYFWKLMWLVRNVIISYSTLIALLVLFLFNLSNAMTTAGVLRILEEPACFRSEIRDPVETGGMKFVFFLINSIVRFYHVGVLFLLVFLGSGIFYKTLQFLVFFIWDWEMGFKNITELSLLHISNISCCLDIRGDNSCRRGYGRIIRLAAHLYLEVVPVVIAILLLLSLVYTGGNVQDSISGFIIAFVVVVLTFCAFWYLCSNLSVTLQLFMCCFRPNLENRRVEEQEDYLQKRMKTLFSTLPQKLILSNSLQRISRIVFFTIIGFVFSCVLLQVLPLLLVFLVKIFEGGDNWEWVNVGLPIVGYMHFTSPIAISVLVVLVFSFCICGSFLKLFYLSKERSKQRPREEQKYAFSESEGRPCIVEKILHISNPSVVRGSFLLISFLVIAGTYLLIFGRLYVLLGFLPLLIFNLLCVFCCSLIRFQVFNYGTLGIFRSLKNTLMRLKTRRLDSKPIIDEEMREVSETDDLSELDDGGDCGGVSDSNDEVAEKEEGGEHIGMGVVDITELPERTDDVAEVFSEAITITDSLTGTEKEEDSLSDTVTNGESDTHEDIQKSIDRRTCLQNWSRTLPIVCILFSVFFWFFLLFVSAVVPSFPWAKTAFNPMAFPVLLILTISTGCGGLCDRTRTSKLRICYMGIHAFVLLLFLLASAYHDWRRGIYFPWPFSNLEEYRKFEPSSLAHDGYFAGKLNWYPNETYEEGRYSICDGSWSGLDVIDLLLFAELSYANEKSEDFLYTYFPQCKDPESKKNFCELKVPVRNSDVTYFHVSAPSLGFEIISIRGTKDVIDFLQDAALWKETSLLQIINIFIPLLESFHSRFVRRFIWLWSILDVISTGFLTFSERKGDRDDSWWMWQWYHPALYHSKIVEYVLENVQLENGTKLYVTGHSLGGGLSQAVVVGLNLVDAESFHPGNTQAFSFAGPGMVATSGKLLGLKKQEMKNTKIENMLDTGIVNIKPDVDFVSSIDFLSGIVQNTRCLLKSDNESLWKLNFGPTKCHASKKILSSLLRSCGNQRNGRVFF